MKMSLIGVLTRSAVVNGVEYHQGEELVIEGLYTSPGGETYVSLRDDSRYVRLPVSAVLVVGSRTSADKPQQRKRHMGQQSVGVGI